MDRRKAGEMLALLGAGGLAAGGTTLAAEGLRDVASGGEEQSALGNAVVTALALAGGAGGAYLKYRGSGPGIPGRLMNNPVTNFMTAGPIARAAQQGADRPLSWIERQGLSPEQLGEVGFNRMFAERADKGLTKGQEAVLDAIGVDRDAFKSKVDAGGSAAGLLQNVLENRFASTDPAKHLSNEALYALGRMADDSGLHSGLRKDSLTGQLAQTTRHVAVPLAGNAAVAGLTVLGLKGAYDIISRMNAGEPVSDEEVAMADKVIKETVPAEV